MAAYLDSLRRLRALDLDVICPGHGPYVDDPAAKLDEYIEHRLDRERRLLAALDAGARGEDGAARPGLGRRAARAAPPAGLALRAHLEKLSDEGRLPEDVDPSLQG